jgi:hypothetical protein
MHSKIFGKIFGVILHQKNPQGLPDWKCIQNLGEIFGAILHQKVPVGFARLKTHSKFGKKYFVFKKHLQGLPD